jgi:hypothetical protein
MPIAYIDDAIDYLRDCHERQGRAIKVAQRLRDDGSDFLASAKSTQLQAVKDALDEIDDVVAKQLALDVTTDVRPAE